MNIDQSFTFRSFKRPTKPFDICRFLVILEYSFIALSLVFIAQMPRSNNYELSIYDASGWIFWVIIIIAIMSGLTNIIIIALGKYREKQFWGNIAFLGIIISNILILAIPIFRGYYLNSFGDEISHLGYIKDIQISGQLGYNNKYPAIHILSYFIISLTQIEPMFIIKIIPIFFYLMYILGIYLIASRGKYCFEQKYLILIFGSTLMFTYFNYLFLPTHLFLYLVPLFIYILFKTQHQTSLNLTFLISIFVILFPLFHPLGTFLLIILISAYCIFVTLIRHLFKKNKTDQSDKNFLNNAYGAVLLMAIVISAWFSRFYLFDVTIRQGYQWFILNSGEPPVEEISIITQSLNVIELIEIILFNYGHILIYSILSVVCILWFCYHLFTKKIKYVQELSFYQLFFLLISLLYVSTLLGDFLMTGKSIRIFCWAILASIFVNGAICYEMIKLKGKKFKMFAFFIIFLIMLSTTTIGIFSIFPSPISKQGGIQVTNSEWSGMCWFFEHKENDNVIFLDQLPRRAPDLIYGRDNEKPLNTGGFIYAGDIFNLKTIYSGKISYYINSGNYFVLSERYRETRHLIWPDRGPLTYNNIIKLDFDQSIIKIYNCDDQDILRVI